MNDYRCITDYITDLFAGHDAVLEFVRTNSAAQGLPPISISPEEGQFLTVLVRACGACRAVEIGTLGGYSGICIARGLARDGRLLTIEQSSHHAAVAQTHFAHAGVADAVSIEIGEAGQILPQIAHHSPLDFVFIDADKGGYPDYYEWAVNHVRAGGIIAAHNALRGGQVIGPPPADAGTRAIRALNRIAANDDRVTSTIFPAGDGMLVAVRRNDT